MLEEGSLLHGSFPLDSNPSPVSEKGRKIHKTALSVQMFRIRPLRKSMVHGVDCPFVHAEYSGSGVKGGGPVTEGRHHRSVPLLDGAILPRASASHL